MHKYFSVCYAQLISIQSVILESDSHKALDKIVSEAISAIPGDFRYLVGLIIFAVIFFIILGNARIAGVIEFKADGWGKYLILLITIIGFICCLQPYRLSLNIEEIIGTYDNNITELKNLARRSSDSGEYKDAAAVYKHIVDILDKRIETASQDSLAKTRAEKAHVQVMQGRALLFSGNLIEAKLILEKASNAGATEANQELCKVYFLSWETQNSINACDKALEGLVLGDSPTSRATVWYYRGLALKKEKKPEEALESFQFAYAILVFAGEDASIVKKEIQDSNTLMTKDLLSWVMAREAQQHVSSTKQPSSQNSPPESTPLLPEPASEKNPFEEKSYPQPSCGDKLPSPREETYSINLYPVYATYSEDSLEKAKTKFCKDAMKKEESGKLQLASFTDTENANKFIDFLKEEFDSLDIGEPVSIEIPKK